MLSVPADTAEGLKEGTQPLQGLRGTDSGTLNNTLLSLGQSAPVGLLGCTHKHTHMLKYRYRD